jgi:hypothetical protein
VFAIVATFLSWYEIRGETSTRTVSGWSMLLDHGVSFEAPIEHSSLRGPTGAITFVAGLLLLAAAYAAWWLSTPEVELRSSHVLRQEVRGFGAGAAVAGGLGLILPLGVAVGDAENHAFIASTPRKLCLLGVLAMSLLVAFAFVPKHYR